MIHIGIPVITAALFLAYFRESSWDTETKISAYLECIAIVFPLTISLICSKLAELESHAGNFQMLLCSQYSRSTQYLSKLLLLLLYASLSTILAIGIFAVVFKNASYSFYAIESIVMVTVNIFLYNLHFAVSLKYGKGVSISLGILETAISALTITGLGDMIWYFLPCSWGSRLCDYIIYIWNYPYDSYGAVAGIQKAAFIILPATILFLILTLIWFQHWEGRKTFD
jgi:ABC-2 type transport system permease protein